METGSQIAMLSRVAQLLILLMLQLALVGLAVTWVRQHRPDAWLGLLWPGVAGALWLVLGQAGQAALNAWSFSALDTGMALSVTSGISLLSTMVHACIFAGLLYGIARLAVPQPKPD